jgi:hypothetical protein
VTTHTRCAKAKENPTPCSACCCYPVSQIFYVTFLQKKGKLYKKNISNVTSFIFFYNSKHTLSVSSLEDAMGAEASC